MKGRVALASLTLGLLACGGAGQPADTPTPDLGKTSQAQGAAPAPSGAAATASGTEDAPSSPEEQAGLKAFDAGNYDQARASFEAASKKNPQNSRVLYNLGQTCEKLGDKPCAEASYKAAIAVNPELDTAAAALSAFYVDARRLDDALSVAKQGLANHPGSGPLHEALGIVQASRKQGDAASQEFTQALEISPREPLFHLTFAHWLNVWHQRGASPLLDTALSLAKDDYAMLASIGFEYRMAGEFASCVSTFDRAVRIKDGGEVRTERALCKLGLKDDKGAFEDLQAAVSAEPTYATGHYYLAGRLATMKRFKEAAGEYRKYLQIDPDGSLATRANERLKAVEAAMKGSR